MTMTPFDRRTKSAPDREKIMSEVRKALWEYGDMATLLIVLPYLGLEMRLVRSNEMLR